MGHVWLRDLKNMNFTVGKTWQNSRFAGMNSDPKPTLTARIMMGRHDHPQKNTDILNRCPMYDTRRLPISPSQIQVGLLNIDASSRRICGSACSGNR